MGMWWTESGPNVDADLSLEIIALRRGEDLRVFVDRLQFPYEVLFGTSAGSWAVASTRPFERPPRVMHPRGVAKETSSKNVWAIGDWLRGRARAAPRRPPAAGHLSEWRHIDQGVSGALVQTKESAHLGSAPAFNLMVMHARMALE
jgi:hypothetical protein